ncbi:MAG: CAP domain-containing protein [Nitrososphaeria archaeon]|nr:CAP domain-containing protein [Nitrososphaeria archaeon]
MEEHRIKLYRLAPLIVFGFIFIAAYLLYINPQIQIFRQNTVVVTEASTSTITVTRSTTSYLTSTVTSALETSTSSIQSANISHLINYALELINNDRVGNGLKPVELGNNLAAQVHAENLAKILCLSHWDTNGMKPYMRYTLFGGKNFVQENVAAVFMFGRTNPLSDEEIKSFLSKLEYEMMYNDAASEWGHRKNILDPSHTHVNIGIAYNSQIVVLVQDFENILIEWKEYTIKNTTIVLNGRFLQNLKPYMFLVYFDPLPTPLSREDLQQAPYNGSYNFGKLLGAILDKGYQTDIPYIYATKWVQKGLDFEIALDLKRFVQAPGVYTIVLEVEDGRGRIYYALSYSIFIK